MSEDRDAAGELADVASTHYLVHFRRPNRLSTVQLADTQPFLAEGGRFAFCHNGSFTRESEFRDQFAGQLKGKADSEVGFRVFEQILDSGEPPEEALARTQLQLLGNANLGYLAADGELVVFNAYPSNRFHRFRVAGAEVAATYFAAGTFFRLDRIVGAARGIVVNDYFDRLALDRALDSIGAAERRLTAEMLGNGAAGAAAVELWVKPRAGEVERIRSAVHEIAGSGMTLSKLAVAASLLGDLVRE